MQQSTGKDFFQLNTAECLAVHSTVASNAERQYRVAGILADSLEFGNAIAHLILGTEELLKAAILLMDGKGFNLRNNPGIRKTFYNHRARHSIFKEFFSMLLLFKTFRQNKTPRLSLFAGLLYGTASGWLNYRWWEKADKLKQNGFYTDYHDGLLDPGTISKSDYDKAVRHTLALKTELMEFMQSVRQMNEPELIAMRKTIEITDLVSLLDESASRK